MEENQASGNYLNIDKLETYVIKCLLTNQTLLSRFIISIKQSYFHSPTNSLIFKIIKSYYKDFQIKIPKDEVPLRLESVLPSSNAEDKSKETRDLCMKTIEEMYNGDEIVVESANKNISNFILRRTAEDSVNKLLITLTDTDSNNFEEKSFYAIEDCVKEIRDCGNISFGNKEPFNLADLKRISEIREEALGDEEHNKIVKLYIKSMNQVMQNDGVGVGSVVCVMATPGCFTGDTRIMTLDGKSETLENLYNSKVKNLEVYSFDKENRNINVSLAESVYLSKYENKLVEIEIDGLHKIKCTYDHPFLLRNGNYKKAEELKIGDSLEPIHRCLFKEKFPDRYFKTDYEIVTNGDNKVRFTADLSCIKKYGRMPIEGKEDLEKIWPKILEDAKNYNHKVTNIRFIELEEPVPVYGLYNVSENHNYALALTENEGIFVSNSGKTTFLINQGLNSAMQGLKVCHCFIGDMEYLDGLIRYYTCYTETENSKIMIANKLLEKEITLRKKAASRYKEGTEAYIRNQAEIAQKEEQLKNNIEIDRKLEEEGKKKVVLDSRQMVKLSTEELETLLSSDKAYMSIAKNIDIYKYAASEISMDALKEEIYNFQKQKGIHYDLIIIDYDGNLKQPADSMYESGGIIYDQAKNLAQMNHSVVFMASQPKQSFWKNELIPIEACAESSKKQMIIDMLITIGRPEGVNTGIRKIYIAKNRRGDENEIFHAKMNGKTGFMYEIFQDEYEALKKQGYDPTLVITANSGRKGQKQSNDDNNDGTGKIELKTDISNFKI